MQQEQKELLQALYEEYWRPLRLKALKEKVPECEVDDIIQDTFCAFMRSYGETALTWNETQRKAVLMKILLNRCHDYFRRSTRIRIVSIDSKASEIEYNIMRYHLMRDVCDRLIADEESRKIQECIEKMKPSWREVAVLHLIEGRPLVEVCEILNISNAACRMRVSRIRKYLKLQLKL